MMRAMKRALLLLGACLAALSCRKPQASTAVATPVPAPVATAPAAWVPGLGELMLSQQMRHAKLWLAGEAGNWKLAAYEADQLRTGFGDVARLHPTHKGAPVPIDQAIETIMTEPLEQMSQAIAKGDREAFREAFDTVTEGCNACHQATDYGYSVLQRPKTNPFPNQDFAPPE
jgi:hypothetical protein